MDILLDVPQDVWQFEIFPLLDYDSRINLNRIMKPEYRVSRRFKKGETLAHAAYCSNQSFGKTLKKFMHYGNYGILVVLLALNRRMAHTCFCVKSFRLVAIARFNSFIITVSKKDYKKNRISREIKHTSEKLLEKTKLYENIDYTPAVVTLN